MRNCFYIATIYSLFTFHVNAQSITPFVIASTGGFGSNGNMSVSWTIGEPIIPTISNSVNFITQGFHQPFNDSVPFPVPVDTGAIVIWHGLTPNGDNFNDTWIIEGIDTIPNNVTIFNRWGDHLWYGENYDNVNVVWNGRNRHGDLLPPATYFYVIILAGKEPKKGWVEVSH